MSGRAGRRGIDDRGIVMFMVDEKMDSSVGRELLKVSFSLLFPPLFQRVTSSSNDCGVLSLLLLARNCFSLFLLAKIYSWKRRGLDD